MDSQKLDIRNLFEAAKNGDSEAFSTIYEHYYTPLYRYVFFRLRGNSQDAEDVTQDVFIKIYGSIGNYIPGDEPNPLPYFYTIARNTLIDRSRKRGITQVNLSEDDETLINVRDESDTPDQRLAKADDAAELRKKIAELPSEQQDVIVLRFIDDLSTKETALALGKTEEAVRQLQSRGLKSLRNLYQK